ncbi:MAG TPA: hypothetical protein VIZ90_11085 [Rhizobiaceae bacterium]
MFDAKAIVRQLGNLSRAINGALGGNQQESLCGRFARTHGHDCLFSSVIGWVLADKDHCWLQRIHELTR